MKVLCVLARHNYGDPRRGDGYEYANLVGTLRRLGHEVLFLDSRDRAAYSDFRGLNEALLRLVERERPDVVFSVACYYEIWLETWEILRDAGISATVNWTTDDSWRYGQFSRFVAPAFHAFTTTYPDAYVRYQRDGITHVLLTQWAANAADFRPPLPASACRYPVSFVGTAHGSRPAAVEALRSAGIEVACFGHGWPQGPVPSGDIREIVRSSVISLNFANSSLVWDGVVPRRQNQIKARTFEVPGAGGFLLTEWADGLDRCYAVGSEIAAFRTIAEAARSIRHYLASPAERDEIARAGYERTLAEHSYDRRLSEVIAFALQQREELFSRRGAPTEGRIDWAHFETAAQRHPMGRKLQLTRTILLAACSHLWGPVRGPRAARRLVYELSWRLAGSRTYSASGWPGRMFYSES